MSGDDRAADRPRAARVTRRAREPPGFGVVEVDLAVGLAGLRVAVVIARQRGVGREREPAPVRGHSRFRRFFGAPLADVLWGGDEGRRPFAFLLVRDIQVLSHPGFAPAASTPSREEIHAAAIAADTQRARHLRRVHRSPADPAPGRASDPSKHTSAARMATSHTYKPPDGSESFVNGSLTVKNSSRSVRTRTHPARPRFARLGAIFLQVQLGDFTARRVTQVQAPRAPRAEDDPRTVGRDSRDTRGEGFAARRHVHQRQPLRRRPGSRPFIQRVVPALWSSSTARSSR